MCEISIIITVYNSEKYLKKTIDSILKQSFSDFELILINDGSTDSSADICELYAKKDNRVKAVHQENGGVSSARNKGIEVSSGKYIGFVDSDDYVETDMYEMLLKNLKKENADLSVCGIYDVYQGKKPKINEHHYLVTNREETIKMILEAKIISVHPVNKLYKKELFQGISYPEGSITEDAAVMFLLLENADKIVIDTAQKYYYYHRENSITTRSFSRADLKTIDIWENNEIYIKKKYPNFAQIAHTRVCWSYLVVLDKLLMNESKHAIEKRRIVRYIRDNFLFIMKNPYFTRNRKIAVILLKVNVNLYRVASYFEYKKNKTRNS